MERPEQIHRAMGPSVALALHLAIANQAIQSRTDPPIIGISDQSRNGRAG